MNSDYLFPFIFHMFSALAIWTLSGVYHERYDEKQYTWQQMLDVFLVHQRLIANSFIKGFRQGGEHYKHRRNQKRSKGGRFA